MGGPPVDHYARVASGDESLHVFGYRSLLPRTLLYWLLCVLLLGIPRLLIYWKPEWLLLFTASASSLADADYILIIDDNNVKSVRRVREESRAGGFSLPAPDGSFRSLPSLRLFSFRKVIYIWFEERAAFILPADISSSMLLGPLASESDWEGGLSSEEVDRRRAAFGLNLIDVQLRSLIVLLFREAISPFYVFQIFSVALWYVDDYIYYATVIVVISVSSIAMDIYQTRSQEKKLRSIVHSSDNIQVIRNGGQIISVNSEELVPGDVMVVPRHGCVLHCDALLMNGTVIVSESMLTGESVPVTKVALTVNEEEMGDYLDMQRHSKHIVFCGTQLLQTRFYRGQPVKALVLRTAFSTLKGQLVRSIMFPKPIDFRFTKDLFKFVGFLACIAVVGLLYTVVVMSLNGVSLRSIIIRALDLVTIVVPPALPAAMSVGTISAGLRLRKRGIFCISPSTINTCGAVNVVCFDKTGTLTEDGLDFHAARAVLPASPRAGEGRPLFAAESSSLDRLEHGPLLKAMASCHSVTHIEGKLQGDPLDLVLLEKTSWILSESEEETATPEDELFDVIQPIQVRPPPDLAASLQLTECTIVRQFPFSSHLQRMSVIVQSPNADSSHDMILYSKGSPEKIRSLCRDSTVPDDFEEVMGSYARHGFRIIALARVSLDISFVRAHRVPRDEVEKDMELLGVVILENRIKPQTKSVIEHLMKAEIRCVMITGDNVLTAASVARECGILSPEKDVYALEHLEGESGARALLRLQLHSPAQPDNKANYFANGDLEKTMSKRPTSAYHLIISGATYAVIQREYPELLHPLVCTTAVFARMSPDQKQGIIHQLQEVDYTVAMCGDGANDCAALKASHAGISLSEAEASIAAPFTSSTADISCVISVVAEGRAALVTSFGVFQYMAAYSLTQFISCLHLYAISTNLGDFQFLYIDLFLITLVALFFGNTPARQKLSRGSPPTRLLSLPTIISVCGVLVIIAFTQFFTFMIVKMFPWYVPFVKDPENDATPSQQATAVFLVSCFQYVILAVIYSKGAPFRESLLSNPALCVVLALTALASLAISLLPANPVSALLTMVQPPTFVDRFFFVLIAAVSVTLCFLFETVLIDRLLKVVWKRRRAAQVRRGEGETFENVLMQIGRSTEWVAGLRRDEEPLLLLPASPAHDNPLRPLCPDQL